MKAFLLAAGLGTRLKPVTDSIPKCLVPVNGQPLIQYWLNIFRKHGISEILINLHYFPGKVKDFIKEQKGDLKIKLFYEPELLGSAGTVKANRKWIKDDPDFLIIYADNLSNVNLTDMISYHRKNKSFFTMGLYRTGRPQECGIATLDENQTIIGFVEKPAIPDSDLANTGIYAANTQVLDYIPDKKPVDFGFDVFPKLIGRMKGYMLREYLLDIGTLENYRRAQQDVKQLNFE